MEGQISYFLYNIQCSSYSVANGLAANRQPKTTMPNRSNNSLFIKMFLRTNYLKEQPILYAQLNNYTIAALKNADRVERFVSCI